MRGVGREIVLVDKNERRALAEADDIFHAVPFAEPLRVQNGGYADLAGSRVVIMAAGVNQRPGETRMELLGRNAAVFREVIPQILDHAPDAVIVVATNPVDVMTHYTARIAAERGIPRGRVLGSGTTLDTARFRALLGRHLRVDPQHVHAYVIGEHGDSEVLTWSLVSVGGIDLDTYVHVFGLPPLDDAARAAIDEGVRRAAYRIIEGKGATYYGIAHDQDAIMTVCAPMDEVAGVRDVTVALPHLLSGEGVQQALPMDLSAAEQEALARSAATVKAAIEQLDQ
jgi:L-lactate dehydrogenase